MPAGSDSVLVFGPFRLFPAQRRLEKDGKPVRLGGRALDLLTVLAERAGEVVSNRALLESVWQDVTVEEAVYASTLKIYGRSWETARPVLAT
jgi:DNA-binding winged helix-turn-helix (wHTH) protein